MQFIIDIIAGSISGVITGFGIGGGTLLVLYLTMFRGTDQLSAQGINLLYFIPTAVCALISHIKNGRVIWRIAVPCALAGVVATSVAAFVATRMDVDVLKRMFGALLIVAGIFELVGKRDKKRSTGS